MDGARMELRVSQHLARACLLERALHDAGPWEAVVHGCRQHALALTRVVIPAEGRVVLLGYLSEPCAGADSADIYCRDEFVMSRALPGSPPSPLRLTLTLGIEDAEIAA